MMAFNEPKINIEQHNIDTESYITIDSNNVEEILTVLNRLQESNKNQVALDRTMSSGDSSSIHHCIDLSASGNQSNSKIKTSMVNGGDKDVHIDEHSIKVNEINDISLETTVNKDGDVLPANIISIEILHPQPRENSPSSMYKTKDVTSPNERRVHNDTQTLSCFTEDKMFGQNTRNRSSTEKMKQLPEASSKHSMKLSGVKTDTISIKTVNGPEVNVDFPSMHPHEELSSNEFDKDLAFSSDSAACSITNISNDAENVEAYLIKHHMLNKKSAKSSSSAKNNKQNLLESYTVHIVDDLQEAKMVMKQHELEQGWNYATVNTQVTFGNTDFYQEKHKVYWEMANINFNDVPFIVAARRTFQCQYGRMQCGTRKNKEKRESLGIPQKLGKNSLGCQSMKLGCPALLCMKEIIQFPGYKIPGNTHYRKQVGARRLKEDLKNKKLVGSAVRKIIVLLPHPSMHKKHPDEQVEIKLRVHPDLYSHLQTLVWKEAIYNTQEVQLKLKDYCINVLFRNTTVPSEKNREYFPSTSTIRLRIEAAIALWNLQDQHAQRLEEMMQKRRETEVQDKVEFNFSRCFPEDATMPDINPDKHSFSAENVSRNVLYCHQTPHHQRMLKRYGEKLLIQNIRCLFSKIPFPVCCIYTQTNVDWQLVGTFIVLAYKKDMIAQALSIFTTWNPAWNPKFIICCHDDEMLEGAEKSFPNTSIYISDCSRNLDWLEWISNPGNEIMENADELLEYINAIADSYTEEDLNSSAARLEECDIWKKSEPLRAWFQSKWLRQAKRWVRGYRPDDYFECQTIEYSEEEEMRPFQELMLLNRKVNLCDIVHLLFTDVIPRAEKRYRSLNKESFKQRTDLLYLHQDIPSYFGLLPFKMLTHIYDRMKLVDQKQYCVENVGLGLYSVQSITDEDTVSYTVEFGDSTSLPTCNCIDWQMFRLPCQHFCSVFKSNEKWTWDMLPFIYRSNNSFTFDWYCLTAADTFDINQSRRDSFSQTEMEVQDCILQTDIQASVDKGVQTLASGNSLSDLKKDVSKLGQDEGVICEDEEILALINECNSVMHQLKKFQLAHHKKHNLKLVLSYLKGAATILCNSKDTAMDKKNTNLKSAVSAVEYHPEPSTSLKTLSVRNVGSKQSLSSQTPVVLSTLLSSINEKLGCSSAKSHKAAQNEGSEPTITLEASQKHIFSTATHEKTSEDLLQLLRPSQTATLTFERSKREKHRISKSPPSAKETKVPIIENQKCPNFSALDKQIPQKSNESTLRPESEADDLPNPDKGKKVRAWKRVICQSLQENLSENLKKVKVEGERVVAGRFGDNNEMLKESSPISLSDVIIAYDFEQMTSSNTPKQEIQNECKRKNIFDTVNKIKLTLQPSQKDSKL